MATVRRRSRQGDAVLACLRGTKSHPTANWVYQQLCPELPNLSLGTVYRNLSALQSSGLVRVVGTVDGFERFDADLSDHGHFICTCCHAVIDVELPELPEPVMTKVCDGVPSDEFRMEITFTGICRDCSQRAE